MYRYTAKENRQIIQTTNRNLKTRQWELAFCSFNGQNCLLNYMKFFPWQTKCQVCELMIGEILEERQHFHKRDLQGKYYKHQSGNPKGIQRFTINHRIRLSLAKIIIKL